LDFICRKHTRLVANRQEKIQSKPNHFQPVIAGNQWLNWHFGFANPQ